MCFFVLPAAAAAGTAAAGTAAGGTLAASTGLAATTAAVTGSTTALTLGTVLQTGGAILSGVTSVLGAMQASSAQKTQLAFQAAMARNNALIAGYRKEQIQRDEERKLAATCWASRR